MRALKVYRERVFPCLSALLWLTFLLLDITAMAGSTWVKFAAICLCFVTALTGAGSPDGGLVAAALGLTVAADLLLLVRSEGYELGVGLFIAVQLLYACRLFHLRGGAPCLWGLGLRLAGLGAAGLLFSGALLPTGGLLLPALSCFCFVNLCVNAAEALALGGAQRTFAAGVLLFLCCDICVGCWNLGLLPGLTGVGIWFFYLPSQVLIVLSQEM